MLSVDIDEADVAVLSQNLTKSQELFSNIAALLRTISSKTVTASRSIKPVFAEINLLTERKHSVEEGLTLLQDVSAYSLRAADAQRILTGSIDAVGVRKYLDCLDLSTQLVAEMKKNIRDFDGVVIGFANTVDKAELNVVSYFGKLLAAADLENGTLPAQNDAAVILGYFASKGNLRSAHETMERVFGRQLQLRLAPLEAGCTLSNRLPKAPYEKGSTGLTTFASEMSICVNGLRQVCDLLQVLGSPVLRNTLAGYMDTRFAAILAGYSKYLDTNGLVGQDLAILDILENLQVLEDTFKGCNFSIEQCPVANNEYRGFISRSQRLLTDWVTYIDARVSQVDRYNEHSIPEVVVEVISKVRKVSEYNSLRVLFEGRKPGSWLDVKPPLRFVSVYTSVVQGADAQADDPLSFLVSSFLLDLIDELMVNLEIGLKEQASGDKEVRKLAQGYMLVKNVVMIETIVNRLEQLYLKLGAVGMERLLKLKNRFLKVFLDDWNHASYIILQNMSLILQLNAANNGQVSTREKEQVKELFRQFNEAFESALRHYERFNIQEKDLRMYLSGEIKKLIINAYNKMYEKYGNMDFTKNKLKYVKYDKQSLERLLNEKL